MYLKILSEHVFAEVQRVQLDFNKRIDTEMQRVLIRDGIDINNAEQLKETI